jgi:hypothetical protein
MAEHVWQYWKEKNYDNKDSIAYYYGPKLEWTKLVTETKRQTRKKKHVAKRKGKIDLRTGKRGKAK